MLRSFFEMYWGDLDSGTFLWVLAVFVPLEILWPVRPLSLWKRIPHLLFIVASGPLIYYLLKLTLAALTGTGILDGAWMGLGSLPKPSWEFLPTLDLAPVFKAIPFPAVAFALLVIFVGDGCTYWWHRAMHAFPVLWPIHKLHHVDEDLNAMTTVVNHPVAYPFAGFYFGLMSVYVLRCVGGEPQASGVIEGLVSYIIVRKFQGWFIHANIKLPFGPLTRVLMGPQVHRIHHSIEGRHQSKNFATFFPFWDIIFGTYYHPKPNEWPKTGLVGEKSLSASPMEILLVPFRAWGEVFKGRKVVRQT